MKILVICQYFYPEQFRVNDICFQFVKDGHEVTVLTGLPNYPSGIVDAGYRWFKNRKETINGVKIVRSWLIGRKNGKVGLSLNYLSFAISSSFKALFLKKDFDVIMVYQLSPVTMAIPGIILKALTKKPMIIYCHDLWPESIASAGITKESKIYKILFYISRKIYNSADKIFISSRLFKEYFENVLRLNKSTIYLPVYAEAIFEGIAYENSSNYDLNLVFAGNIGEMQSVETIIHAANELRNHKHIKWHIVGDGSARKRCEVLAAQMRLESVLFHGQHSISEMPYYYNLADAFLVTMKANKEISYTLPNKVQSYMAAGKPIIGAIDGETRAVINEANCGVCCAAEDAIALADVVSKFDKNRENHVAYGINAKLYYERHFSKKVYMQRLFKMLQEINLKEDDSVVY